MVDKKSFRRYSTRVCIRMARTVRIHVLIQSYSKKEDAAIRRSAYKAFDKSIHKLNETMGVCIK